MPYSLKFPEEKAARAYGHELRTSWKNAINICHAIQGLEVRKAEALLESVIRIETPIKMVRRNRKIAAKPGIGKGRYPVKSADRTLKVLRNAINNAEYQGLDPDKMVIVHAQAYKGRSLKGFMPRAMGRATKKNEETCNLEIFIQEKEEA
jgi:large subunit ribosomal protein L22